MSEVIDNFIEMVKSDIYILTFITAPFLKPESISKALKIMIDNKLDSIHSVQKIKSFLCVCVCLPSRNQYTCSSSEQFGAENTSSAPTLEKKKTLV